MSIVISFLIFTIIVVIHELGHYMAARKCGILVEEFAVGMGPKVIGIKKGDTLYSLRLFPIGGFCKMLGEDENAGDERAFNNKTTGQRFLVIVAGVVMNFLLAFILFTGLVFVSVINEPVVQKVMPDSPAMDAGLMIGDRIVKIDNTKVNIYEDLAFALNDGGGRAVFIDILREGEVYQKEIVPMLDPEDEMYKIGFALTPKAGIFMANTQDLPRAGFVESLKNGCYRIAFYVKITLTGLTRLVTMKLSIDQMSGPIGIVDVISTNYNASIERGVFVAFVTMAQFMAVLSANLAVFNLLPLPALDGGRLVFITIEAIAKKPVPREKEGMIHFVGFMLLILLAVFVAYNDISKFF